ncbi:hypothetical protein GGX14DRAFT_390162 [Mycena pura]|uniref:Uncharacterized protein n=1 Tax=Mycena pura TaxID=153505 RepID=A0AAD6YHW0_9AGAR|nr:hypothetical protein GGX14DRAFT_390162 [Mycena pura]
MVTNDPGPSVGREPSRVLWAGMQFLQPTSLQSWSIKLMKVEPPSQPKCRLNSPCFRHSVPRFVGLEIKLMKGRNSTRPTFRPTFRGPELPTQRNRADLPHGDKFGSTRTRMHAQRALFASVPTAHWHYTVRAYAPAAPACVARHGCHLIVNWQQKRGDEVGCRQAK